VDEFKEDLKKNPEKYVPHIKIWSEVIEHISNLN